MQIHENFEISATAEISHGAFTICIGPAHPVLGITIKNFCVLYPGQCEHVNK